MRRRHRLLAYQTNIGQALHKDPSEIRKAAATERARRVLEKHTVAVNVIEEVVAAVKSALAGRGVFVRGPVRLGPG